MPDSAQRLHALREMARRRGSRSRAAATVASGHAGIDAALGGGLARGRLHELFGTGVEEAGCTAGFAAMLAVRALQPGRCLLWLRTARAEQQAGALYAPGLAALGLDPAALLLAVLDDDTALLRAAAEALRCAALGAVVIECWGAPRVLDLTATRRLGLAAEGSGVTALLLRLDAEPVPSAAETRWRVSPAASAALAANAPGPPALGLELLRQRGGPAGQRWRAAWDGDRRALHEAPLSGAVVSDAADRPAGDRAVGPGRRAA